MGSIGEKIKQFRIKRGVSQLDLEMEIGTSTGRISKIESGKINPNKETLAKIIDALHLSIYDAADIYEIPFKKKFQDFITSVNEFQGNLDLEDLSNKIIEDLKIQLDAISVGLFFWNSKEELLKLHGFSHDPKYFLFLKKMNLERSFKLKFSSKKDTLCKNICLRSLKMEETLFTQDINDFLRPFYPKPVGYLCQSFLGMKNAVTIPMVVEDKKIGIIWVAWGDKYLNEGRKKQLEYIANQIAISLYNAKRYSDLEEKYNLLKTLDE